MSSAATAQLGGSVSIDSDYRWRGYTLSAGHPVASAQVSFDHGSIYANASGTLELREGDVHYLGFHAGGGYSAWIAPELSLDIGGERTEFRPGYPDGPHYDYTQFYVGLSRKRMQARLSYSPDYLFPDWHMLYAETEGTLKLTQHLNLNAHAGVAAVLSRPASSFGSGKAQYDWRIGLSQSFGNAEVHAIVSGGGPSQQRYEYATHGRTALTVGASFSF